jgi:quinolinate synthase
MAMNGLANLADVLERGHNEIFVDPAIAARARVPIDRMLDFAAAHKKRVQASGDLQRDQQLFANVGAA